MATPPKPVNKYDGVQIKHLLDDAVGTFFDKKGHEEDNSVSDFRLGLGLACCFFAALAQFYPAPYPDNKVILAICVASYGICNFILTYMSWFVDRKTFLRTKPSPSRPIFYAGSSLPRFTDIYTLTLTAGGFSASTSSSVGAFVTEDGFLADAPFNAWAEKVYSECLTKKSM